MLDFIGANQHFIYTKTSGRERLRVFKKKKEGKIKGWSVQLKAEQRAGLFPVRAARSAVDKRGLRSAGRQPDQTNKPIIQPLGSPYCLVLASKQTHHLLSLRRRSTRTRKTGTHPRSRTRGPPAPSVARLEDSFCAGRRCPPELKREHVRMRKPA